jgi:hypothetical protein
MNHVFARAAISSVSLPLHHIASTPHIRHTPRKHITSHPIPASIHTTTIAYALRPGETEEQALERRIRESQQVEDRVVYISTEHEFNEEMERAGDRLVVLEVHSDEICQTGFDEEPELHWKGDVKAAQEPCAQLKHVFLRTARECPDVVFLDLEVGEDSGADLADKLGVDVLPSIQFWRSGKLLWEHKGHAQLSQNMGEGVLFYGDTAGNNVKASDYVTDLKTRADFDNFIASQSDQVLTVVNIAFSDAAPCIHVFPAILALAKNFVGYAAFARVMADENPELQQLMKELNILEVPTFLFYRNGQPTGRHVGGSRGDLIGKILQQQSAAGIAPPPPPEGAGQRKRGGRRKTAA